MLKKRAKLHVVKVEGLSIVDLAVAYATKGETRCTFIYVDGFIRHNSGIRVRGLRGAEKYIIDVYLEHDSRRFDEGANEGITWIRARILYSELDKTGIVSYPRFQQRK